MRVLLRMALAALAYFGSARLGYAFAIPGGVVTLWPPAGVMLALLILSDRRDWPALVAGGVIGSFASDRFSGYSLPFALSASLANLAESVLAAAFVRWRLGRRMYLSTLRDVVGFTAGVAILTNSLTACLGAVVINHVGTDPLGRSWFVWWVGDGLGMLIVAPVLLTWANALQYARTPRPRVVLEGGLLVAALVATAQIALGPRYHWAVQPGPYSVFPLLFWAAVRFGPAGSATASLIVAAVATWNAALGVGPFALATSTSVNIAAQVYAYLAVVSLTALLPAAVLEERAVAGQQLLESEERYRSVVDAATDAIVTIDASSRIQFANPAATRVFGYATDELVGQEVTMLMPAQVRAMHKAGVARYLATGQKKIEWRGVTLTGIHKEGREIPLEISFGELVTKGGSVFTGILRDISERRAAEQALSAAEDRMRFAMEASRVGVWEVEFATGVARWSETLEALHGMAPGTFGGTFPAFLEQIHPDDRAAIGEEIERATRQHTDANIEYRSTWPDGTVHWLSGVGRTFYDSAGTPLRAAGIGLDVTERRSLEEQYRQSQKMDAIGQLAGGVAHDFNNLLTAIHGYGSMVADDLGPDSPHQADLAEILRAADRAASLTRQLLAFSRRQILAPGALNLSDSLRAMQPMLTRLIGEHIDIAVRAPDDIGRVIADAGQIEQVILNLAINARDAMPDGGTLLLELVNVVVTESYQQHHIELNPGAYVMLAVSDSGVGMDADTLTHVFEPFYTTKALSKGTGLGLSTVYGIVNQSGGSVLVYSEPGHGTTFKVYLPRVETEPEVTAIAESTETRRRSETVLVTEDDEALRTLVRRILETRGYRVLVAATPHEALRIANSDTSDIHLLLTDVVLPEMGGRSLAELLVANHPGLRVLYMSGYTDDAIVHRGVLERDTQFIQKPFGHEALLRKVQETLDKPARG